MQCYRDANAWDATAKTPLFCACDGQPNSVCEPCMFTAHVLFCMSMHAAPHLHHIRTGGVAHGPPVPCVSALTALTWQPESGNRMWKISAASIDDMCSYQPWAAALGGSHDDR